MVALLTVQGVLSDVERKMLDKGGTEAFRKETEVSRQSRHTGDTLSMKATIELLFRDRAIKDASWSYMEDGRHFTVNFTVASNEEHDELLEHLTSKGFGADENSHVYHQPLRGNLVNMNKRLQAEKAMSMMDNLVSTVMSRKSVIDVLQTTKSRTEFSCDYVIELITASVIATASLASDNIAGLVASMLLSPLLDPILGLLFGFSFGIRYMVRASIKSLVFSLLIILLSGFVSGPLCFMINYFTDYPFPTASINDRVVFAGFWSTFILATFSAPNLTSALLNDNQGAKVGNAISLSLLPPIANSGLLLFHAFITLCLKIVNSDNGVCSYQVSFYNTQIDKLTATDDTCYLPLLMLRGAGVSCLITIMNVIIILAVGFVIFKLKKIRPNSLFRGEIKKFVMEVNNENILRTIQTSHPEETFYKQNLKKFCEIQNIDPKNLSESELTKYKEEFETTVNEFPRMPVTFDGAHTDQFVHNRRTNPNPKCRRKAPSFRSNKLRTDFVEQMTREIAKDARPKEEETEVQITVTDTNGTVTSENIGTFQGKRNPGFQEKEFYYVPDDSINSIKIDFL